MRKSRLDAGYGNIKGDFTDRLAAILGRNPDTLRNELSKGENGSKPFSDEVLHAIAEVTGRPFLDFDRAKRWTPPTDAEFLAQALQQVTRLAQRLEKIADRLDDQVPPRSS